MSSVRRTHAARTCSTCKKRKVRCELPDVNVLSTQDIALPTSKACHRCRILNIDCFVDSRRGQVTSTPAKEPSSEGGLTKFSIFSEAPFSPDTNDVASNSKVANSKDAHNSNLTSRTPEAALEAERQSFWRCLDVVAQPLDLLQRLANAQSRTIRSDNATVSNTYNSIGDLHDILAIVTDQLANELQQSLERMLLFAPYLPNAADLRSSCQTHSNLPSLFLLTSMYFLAVYTKTTEASTEVKDMLQPVAKMMQSLKTRIMTEAPYHSYSIMALDLINTYDPLAESAILSLSLVDDNGNQLETPRKRKERHENMAQGKTGYRKTKGEAMMSRSLCFHMRSTISSLRDNDLSMVGHLSELYLSVELNAMLLLEDYDMVQNEAFKSSDLDINLSEQDFHRTLGRLLLRFRFTQQNCVQGIRTAFRHSRQRHVLGLIDVETFMRELDDSVQKAEIELETSRLQWELESSKFLARGKAEALKDYVQLEVSACRSKFFTLVYRASAWPLTKQDHFASSWQGDPLAGGTEQSLTHHRDQLQIPTRMIELIKSDRDHPIAKLGIKYAHSRNDVAEESLAIFLTIPTADLLYLPHANICSILVHSSKILMETQAASMQFFQGHLPRQRTWDLLLRQVGEKATKMGQNDTVGRLHHITGNIIMQMNLAVQTWKDNHRQKQSQSGGRQSFDSFSASEQSINTSTTSEEINLDLFWAEDPLDALFASLLNQQNFSS